MIGIPLALLSVVAKFLTGSIISGVTAIIVTQLAVMPMKPVRLRVGFDVLRQRWRPFFKTGFLLALRILLGWIACIVPGIVITVRYYLWAPVVLMEGLETKAARLRARALASRSWRTMILVMVIQFLVPIIASSIVGALIGFNTNDAIAREGAFQGFHSSRRVDSGICVAADLDRAGAALSEDETVRRRDSNRRDVAARKYRRREEAFGSSACAPGSRGDAAISHSNVTFSKLNLTKLRMRGRLKDIRAFSSVTFERAAGSSLSIVVCASCACYSWQVAHPVIRHLARITVAARLRSHALRQRLRQALKMNDPQRSICYCGVSMATPQIGVPRATARP